VGTCGAADYTYDAENRMVTAGGYTYVYDGDGKRVKKFNGSTGRLYWTGVGADAIQESDLSFGSLERYVFFGGKRIARRLWTGAVQYYFADHLGTSRVVTNATGGQLDDQDFYPYGAIVPGGTSTSGQNYKFTGKERDGESGLDYFIARHYGSNWGRFLQADEFSGGPVDAFSSSDPLPPGPLPYADITNPQSMNKYAYTYNNPMIYTDPDGHSVWTKLAKVVLKGGDVASVVASAKEDVKKVFDSNASILDRVEAAGRAGSEFLPFSASDAEEVGTLAGETLAAADESGGFVALAQKTYQTYTKTNPETGEVYSGKTSGTGTPQENVTKRDRSHHRTKDGFGPAKLDKSSKSADAISGREQLLHEHYKKKGKSGNQRNPVGRNNPNYKKYVKKALELFGVI
jgi:RHS repeat-associated protein